MVPLSPMAPWKSPRAWGATTWWNTDLATGCPSMATQHQLPALSPEMTTLAGSPPRAPIFAWIQASARLWSRKPCVSGTNWTKLQNLVAGDLGRV